MKQEDFVLDFERKARETIEKYKLIKKSDKVLVAASGGKDSTAVLYLLKKFGFRVEALYINLHMGKYSENCLKNVEKFCRENKIRLHVLNLEKEFGMRMCSIRCEVQKKHKVSNCMVCGIIKKWLLNREARKLKADKIATGHNLDDEAQTVIINFLQGNLMLGANSGPKTGSIKDAKFIQRIKPLYFLPEKDILKYAKIKNFPIVSEKCPCSANSLRIRTREFLNKEIAVTKRRIVENFLKILPGLREKLLKEKLKYCKNCGEPSMNERCRKCEILSFS